MEMPSPESAIARFCIPKSAERDALRAVFRSKGCHRVWILDGDMANLYFFAEGLEYSEEKATEMCFAITAVVPGRKAEILPISIMGRATTEIFMDVGEDDT